MVFLKVYRSVLIKGKRKRRNSGSSESRSHQNSPTELNKDRSKWDLCEHVQNKINFRPRRWKVPKWSCIIGRGFAGTRNDSNFSGNIVCPLSHSFEAMMQNVFLQGNRVGICWPACQGSLACQLKPCSGNTLPNCLHHLLQGQVLETWGNLPVMWSHCALHLWPGGMLVLNVLPVLCSLVNKLMPMCCHYTSIAGSCCFKKKMQ